MKKIIMAVAIVCAAALGQAATCSWSMSGAVDSKGNSLAGYAYVFCTKAATGGTAYSVADVTAALAEIKTAAALQTYLENNSLSDLNSAVASGAATVTGVDTVTSGAGVPAGTSSVKLFAVVVDDATFGDSVKYCVTAASAGIKTAAASTSNNNAFTVPGAATATADNWKSIPEPTSGLLLLVGMAGLALRRRRA